ncbi:hypothetical protein ACIS_01028 [Anaplasma centrale str. Israel]|uniref:Uncharacterized protein n=1 Tax=Anaplasma centrale (strain Israel) TaxID=574556 RepID=D1ASQ8_ANACI|nr:hypothetical protein [Anaplasma centrale]ACZ49511.1 hypothetical protein ACIS_01028 [Anaplasma centrale str. Israel]
MISKTGRATDIAGLLQYYKYRLAGNRCIDFNFTMGMQHNVLQTNGIDPNIMQRVCKTDIRTKGGRSVTQEVRFDVKHSV